MLLQGKVVIVTGASYGIGRAYALAQEGATVVAVGPPIVSLARHSAATLTGQVLHAGEHGKSWN